MSQQPFIQISNQQIYDKLVKIEASVQELTPIAQTVAVDHERLRAVELEFARLEATLKVGLATATRHKVAVYSALAAGLGGVATAIVPLVVK